MEKSSLKVEVEYNEQISRLFVFRGFWVFVMIWPMYALLIGLGVVNFLHFFHMLFLGKRAKSFWGYNTRFFIWMMSWNSYFMKLTDERPGFWW